ncbi:aminopeptidase N [Gilvimarinus xylanilyticus]|uniref:Aminopeptidase N n=1 Tax=Gilvimarinus xylanilyticus TaxID=2944139 RepID=A0A9X2HUD1_9GAMM|nr:aminopeptidase N [Gilvimarinus xylanilyticus]MCP8898405.1 aminopeptidase N [Gilvimarinus xylanilyticus]
MTQDLSSNNSDTVYLKDYQSPAYAIEKTDLDVAIYPGESFVEARLQLVRQSGLVSELALDGEQLELLAIEINSQSLSKDQYRLDDGKLVLIEPPERFELYTKVRIQPEQNTSLEGLYRSRTIYCTQCEAEGFRKITYYLDRPDVMSDFTTRISAAKSECPILLANGNLVEQGDLTDGRHYAVWHDPHKKPCYLFALVAGDLSVMEDHFVTASGRNVDLKIYVEEKDLDKCDHAMASLKNAMRWDEEVYGREYDLDIFMIVAVDDFNMGAMENKGLNIFNTSCVLAKPETTTDAGFQRVEGVVAHEYFHNWSGNRVTCRDWFQLSLKEGFTVYRDAEFSADMGSPTVKRVEDVAMLRTHQFAEDAGPMAHPIRPASYMEISNFYTLTIYEKGAEVVRMLANLLGPELFRKGTDLYFERHDGQAVTTEDFVQALADVSGRDFSVFQRWYNQAGTPQLEVRDEYDENTREYTLHITQSTPATPECADKQPFHIPIAMGLLGDAGEIALKLRDEELEDLPTDNTHRVLELTEQAQSFVFTDVPEKPVPSLLRGFSAPVKLKFAYSRDDLVRLALRDSDGFNRYEACQRLALGVIEDALAADSGGELNNFTPDERLLAVYQQLLQEEGLDRAMLAYMLLLPSEGFIAEQQSVIDPIAIHRARGEVAGYIAKALHKPLLAVLENYDLRKPYKPTAVDIAARLLKNTALEFLMREPDQAVVDLCVKHLQQANNMTDELASLTALVNSRSPLAADIAPQKLADFYAKWQDESLVVNAWLALQARNANPGGVERVEALLAHPAFEANNPNKIRSVVGVFANANPVNFHGGTDADPEAGYRFLADQVIALDSKNPQIAARLITPLTRWRRYDKQRGGAMRGQLERIKHTPGLSSDSNEIVSKSL